MIPARVEDITPGWLSEVLGVEVSSCEPSPTGDVAGFVGVVARLTLEHAAGLPDSLVVKLRSPDPQALEYVSNYGLYRSEFEFYSQLAQHATVRVPRCYHSDLSDDGLSIVLLLEDLGRLRLGDQLHGAAPAEAERVVRAIASLHASWWNNPELEAFMWLPSINADLNKARQDHAAHSWPAFLDRYGSSVTASSLQVGELIQTRLAPMLDRWCERGPMTFAHFDVRLDNIFFDDAVGGVCLIDWQMSQRSLGASDLAWFLSWSLTIPVRQISWDRLLRAYHDELTERGVSGYSYQRLVDDVRECLCLVAAMAVLGGATAPRFDERSGLVIDALVERVFSSLDDLDVGSCL